MGIHMDKQFNKAFPPPPEGRGLHADKTMKVGVFTDALTSESKKKLILDSNFGQEFMTLYQRYRTNMHIVNVAELMHKMELLHDTYEGELMKIRRKGE